MTLRISKRERIGSDKSTFSENDAAGLYLPCTGLAAAITEHLALRLVTIPAFDIEMLCCSMASWMDVLSCSFILSN